MRFVNAIWHREDPPSTGGAGSFLVAQDDIAGRDDEGVRRVESNRSDMINPDGDCGVDVTVCSDVNHRPPTP